MKKRGYFISLILAILMLCPNTVLAACDYSEQVKLSSEAANVKFSYEAGMFKTGNYFEQDDILVPDDVEDLENLPSGELIPEEVPEVRLSVLNITEDIYVVITNDFDNSREEYYYDDTEDGILNWTRQEDALYDKVTYTLEVYALDSSCKAEALRSIKLETPRYNELSEYAACENSSEYYCQAFTTLDFSLSTEDAIKRFEQKQNPQESSSNTSSEKSFFELYGIYLLIGFVVIVIIGVVTYVIVRKTQRSTIK